MRGAFFIATLRYSIVRLFEQLNNRTNEHLNFCLLQNCEIVPLRHSVKRAWYSCLADASRAMEYRKEELNFEKFEHVRFHNLVGQKFFACFVHLAICHFLGASFYL